MKADGDEKSYQLGNGSADSDAVQDHLLLMALVNNSPDDMCVRGSDGSILIWNNTFASSCRNMFGIEPYVGLRTVDLIPADQIARFENLHHLFQRAIKGETVCAEFDYRWPNGEEHSYELVLSSVRLNGDILGVSEVTRDITERKQCEDRLKAAEARYRSIVENAQVAILVNQSDRVKYCNPMALEWTGYTLEDFKSTPFIDFIHPDYQQKVLQEYRERLSGEKPLSQYPIRMISKSGETRWVLVNSARISWEGEPASLILITDYSRQKLAETFLLESQLICQEAQRIAHLGSWYWNIASNELKWSDEVYRIFDLSPQQFNGSYEAFLACVHPDDNSTVQEAVKASLESPDQPYSIEHRIVIGDGSVRHIHERGEVEFDDAGQPIRMVGTVLDITDRKLAHKELSDRLDLERFVNELSRVFLNISIHEVDSQIESSLRDLIRVLEVDRASIYSPDDRGLRRTHTATRAGAEPAPQHFLRSEYPVLAGRLVDYGDMFTCEKLSDLSEDYCCERDHLTEIGVKSYLAMTLAVGGTIVAVLTIANLQHERSWPEELVSRLSLVADIVANALHRKQSREIIEYQSQQMSSVFQARPDLLLILSIDGVIQSHEGGQSLIAIDTLNELDGRTVQDIFPARQRGRITAGLARSVESGRLELFKFERSDPGERLWWEVRIMPFRADSMLMIVSDVTTRVEWESVSELQNRLLDDTNTASDITELLQVVLIEIAEFFDWEYGDVWLPEERGGNLFRCYSWSVPDPSAALSSEDFGNAVQAYGYDLADTVARQKSPVYVSGPKPDSAESIGLDAVHAFDPASVAGIPVLEGDKVLAVFTFYSNQHRLESHGVLDRMLHTVSQLAPVIRRRLIEDELHHFIEAAPNPMLITASDGWILKSNESATRLFGYAPSDFAQMVITSLVRKGDRHLFDFLSDGASPEAKLQSAGGVREVTGLTSDGTAIPLGLSVSTRTTLQGPRLIVSLVDLREQKASLDRLTEYSGRLQQLTRHLHELTERERRSVARDLHDDLGQVLTSLKMDLSLIERRIADDPNETRRSQISEEIMAMYETIDAAIDRVSAFIGQLRPEMLDNLGLIAALEWQVEEFERRHRISCSFNTTVKQVNVDDETAIAMYRMVQESLTNVARHAQADNVTMRLGIIQNTLSLEIADDGVGISEERFESNDRFGLMGMKERASALGGMVDIVTNEEGGTTVEIIVPICPPGEGNEQDSNRR